MTPKKINVLYGDKRVGELRDFGDQTGFAYAESFLPSGHRLSPIELPMESRVFVKNNPSLQCLPGIFADSLPDAYGRRIMYDWYARHVGEHYAVTAADMLAYVGHQGMGALTYEPAREEYDAVALKELDLSKAEWDTRAYLAGKSTDVLESLRALAKTVGGSFPKALIALDPDTGKTFEERRALPSHLEHWIVKFGVGDKRPRGDFSNYPEVEMAYLNMARDCGIAVPDFRAFETTCDDGQTLRHLGVRRFDFANGQRLHYASLAGLTGTAPDYDYWDYGHLLEATEKVVADFRATREQCRRMIFNVGSANLDDHAKNHGFLYDGKEWSVAPAFDLGYWGFRANAPQALSVLAQIKAIPFLKMKKLCVQAGMKGPEVDEMGEQIRTVLEKASSYLDKWGVPRSHNQTISAELKKRIEMSLEIKTSVALPPSG